MWVALISSLHLGQSFDVAVWTMLGTTGTPL